MSNLLKNRFNSPGLATLSLIDLIVAGNSHHTAPYSLCVVLLLVPILHPPPIDVLDLLDLISKWFLDPLDLLVPCFESPLFCQ